MQYHRKMMLTGTGGPYTPVSPAVRTRRAMRSGTIDLPLYHATASRRKSEDGRRLRDAAVIACLPTLSKRVNVTERYTGVYATLSPRAIGIHGYGHQGPLGTPCSSSWLVYAAG